jgi:CO dehydrogenase/acetyl-CoA synthase beta subunit
MTQSTLPITITNVWKSVYNFRRYFSTRKAQTVQTVKREEEAAEEEEEEEEEEGGGENSCPPPHPTATLFRAMFKDLFECLLQASV